MGGLSALVSRFDKGGQAAHGTLSSLNISPSAWTLLTQTVSRESENGDWLRQRLVFVAVSDLPTMPVPWYVVFLNRESKEPFQLHTCGKRLYFLSTKRSRWNGYKT